MPRLRVLIYFEYRSWMGCFVCMYVCMLPLLFIYGIDVLP